MKTKEYKLLRDDVANIILTDKDCIEYVESIVSLTIGIPKESISLELLSPRVNTNINTKYSYVDSIYEDDTFIVNIEINYNKSNITKVKNMRYICHLILKQMLVLR